LYYYIFFTFVSSKYSFISSKKTWEDAQKYCILINGTLANIKQSYDNVNAYDALEEPSGGWSQDVWDPDMVWLGITDCTQEDTWQNVDGSEANYTNWSEGEPNNYCGGREACVAYMPGVTDYKWFDVGCNAEAYFVCQVDEGIPQIDYEGQCPEWEKDGLCPHEVAFIIFLVIVLLICCCCIALCTCACCWCHKCFWFAPPPTPSQPQVSLGQRPASGHDGTSNPPVAAQPQNAVTNQTNSQGYAQFHNPPTYDNARNIASVQVGIQQGPTYANIPQQP